MTDSRQPGFNFYRNRPFGYGVTPLSDFSVANSVININQSTNFAMCLLSTCGKSGHTWTGNSFHGGAYFEASISNSTADPTPSTSGWPAFWMMSDEFLWGSVTNNFWEVDFYEKYYSDQRRVWAVHEWLASGSQITRVNGLETHPSGYNFNQFHTYGMLWVPGDRYVFYTDNVAVGTYTYANNSSLVKGDNQSWNLILGTSGGWPMQVDWVRVWQRDS
jgi:hypothetical protein